MLGIVIDYGILNGDIISGGCGEGFTARIGWRNDYDDFVLSPDPSRAEGIQSSSILSSTLQSKHLRLGNPVDLNGYLGREHPVPRGDGSMHDSASYGSWGRANDVRIHVCPTLLPYVDGLETSGTVTETCMSFE